MDGSDWLRTQLATFECPACGGQYRGSEMRMLAERDGLYFVDLDCGSCGSRTVAILTVEANDSEPTIADASELQRAREPAVSAVNADDVLDMHQFLAAFQGDVEHLFKAAAARSDGAPQR
jgi:transcription elongation factor Elf1